MQYLSVGANLGDFEYNIFWILAIFQTAFQRILNYSVDKQFCEFYFNIFILGTSRLEGIEL